MKNYNLYKYNRKKYEKVDEIPDNGKKYFGEVGKDGIPEIFRGRILKKINTYIYNGKVYNDINQIPEKGRKYFLNIKDAEGKANLKVKCETKFILREEQDNIHFFIEDSNVEKESPDELIQSPWNSLFFYFILFFIVIILSALVLLLVEGSILLL